MSESEAPPELIATPAPAVPPAPAKPKELFTAITEEGEQAYRDLGDADLLELRGTLSGQQFAASEQARSLLQQLPAVFDKASRLAQQLSVVKFEIERRAAVKAS